ncbi:hypothetical protein EI94DRAFT_1729858, partial [Lactarius quietus]
MYFFCRSRYCREWGGKSALSTHGPSPPNPSVFARRTFDFRATAPMRPGCVPPYPRTPCARACCPTPCPAPIPGSCAARPHAQVAPGCRRTGWGSRGRGVGARSPGGSAGGTRFPPLPPYPRLARKGVLTPLPAPLPPPHAQRRGAGHARRGAPAHHPGPHPSEVEGAQPGWSALSPPTPQLACKGEGRGACRGAWRGGGGAPVGRAGEGSHCVAQPEKRVRMGAVTSCAPRTSGLIPFPRGVIPRASGCAQGLARAGG